MSFSFSLLLALSILVGAPQFNTQEEELTYAFDDLKVTTSTYCSSLKDEQYVDVKITGYTGEQFLDSSFINGNLFLVTGEKVAPSLTLESMTLPYVKYTNKATGEEYGSAGLLRGQEHQSTHFEFTFDASVTKTIPVALYSGDDVDHKVSFDPIEFKSPTQNFTVVFDSNGGSSILSIQVTLGSKLTIPQMPTKDGCIFAGWHSDITLQNIWDFTTSKVNGNLTLFAKWVKDPEKFAVNFETNGGSCVDDYEVESGALLTSNETTRPGYTFAGWYKTANLKMHGIS